MIKRFLLLFAITFGLVLSVAEAGDKGDKADQKGDKAQARSVMFMDNAFLPDKTSFPMPFSETNNSVTAPAISTGYYFIDSDDEAEDYWRPVPGIIDTSDTYAGTWVKIQTGPRQKPYANEAEAISRWADPTDWGVNGYTFFRNPALPIQATGANYFTHGPMGATDSTDNAIAGPMPIFINGGFYFNGIRYDSFYVSTNGLICLTNRRYRYDAATGLRKNEGGDCYDPMSMDWYVGSFYNAGTGTTIDRTRHAEGSESSTNTAVEPVEDNFGYEFAVLGGDRWNSRAGIRMPGSPGTLLTSFNDTHKAALIAPFYGDLQLSQWSTTKNSPDEHGVVWFRKFSNGDTLCIYFINVAPVNTVYYTTGNTTSCSYDLRPSDASYISASAQVLLCRKDSSIVVNYESFTGSKIVGSRGYPCKEIFRFSTSCGVRGFARHVGYHHWTGVGGRGAAREYEQYTHYYANYRNSNVSYPKPSSAVKFKQWQNTLRVADISYRVRSLDVNDDLTYSEVVSTEFVNDYELLAGEERIGAIQPVAIIQNLTNEIQGPVGSGPSSGINFVEQELNFRAVFRIYNEASGKPIYNRLVAVDSAGLAIDNDDRDAQNEYFGDPNVKVRYSSVTKSSSGVYTATPITFPGSSGFNGIPPYGFVEVYFPPFEPNEFVESQIGRLKAMIIADPKDPQTLQELGDKWPFDDKDSVNLFSMNRLTSFKDDVTEYHNIYRENIPSVLKWVSIRAEVMPGDGVSRHPLPPRRLWDEDMGTYTGFKAANNDQEELYSPVIRLNRIQNTPLCDEIRSFPIDLRGRKLPVLAVSVQRNKNSALDTWDRGWSDGMLIGPEPRCIINSDIYDRFTYTRSASSSPDALVVELAESSPDQVHGITNIGVALPFVPSALRGSWMNHPRRGGAKPVTNMPAYTLYGGGGAEIGFLEEDRDSSLAPPQYPSGPRGGLREDLFDDGIDFEYQKLFVPIPDTFINAPNEGAKNFRFRIRVAATDDKKCVTCIPDDEDPYFVDNVTILFPTEQTDVELSSVRIIWPYTVAPASQFVKVPVRAKISNNTSISAPTFTVTVAIYRGNYLNHDERPVYCKVEELPYLSTGSEIEVVMPDWDARKSGKLASGNYHMKGWVSVPDGDLDKDNDTTYYDFKLNFGDIYAYDPWPASSNDVPSFSSSASSGRGLCLQGYSEGGYGTTSNASQWSAEPYSFGAEGGNSSGQIAMKFEVFEVDTIKGYQAYFGEKNMAPDYITFRVYKDQAGLPGQEVPGSRIARTQRGKDDVRNDYFYGEYVTFLLPEDEPLILPRGKYWVAVAQLGETGIELGASAYKMGMRITQVYIPPPSGGYVGGNGNHLVIHKEFRYKNNYDNLLNDNLFAYENTAESNEWVQFMPNMANPAYGHLHHYGVSPQDNYTWTLSRGTWIPMLRPYLGEKNYSTEPEYEDCPADPPVELTYFDGEARDNGVDLYWETASEINNYGFYVERREGEPYTQWQKIGFVAGNGTTNSVSNYSFFDNDVNMNTTYQYRLRQVDLDGAVECTPSIKYVTINFGTFGNLVLEPVAPNPVSNDTKIKFVTPEDAHVTVEILDIFGNVVTTIANETMSADVHTFNWDVHYSDGRLAPSGAYILRVTAGDQVQTTKITVAR